jgi:hypothetical protein
MKEYQRKGMMAEAILRRDNTFGDPEYVQEFELETKPSRVIRNRAFKQNERDKRRDQDDLDD